MKNKKISELFWRIGISALGVALIAIAIAHLLLFFFGETASASVSTRRRGGAAAGRTPSLRYEWTLDYTFKDINGVTYSGNATRRGSDISVKTDNKVYYFTFAPFIHTLASDAEPNLIQPLFVGAGVILLYTMNMKKKEKNKGRNTANGWGNKK